MTLEPWNETSTTSFHTMTSGDSETVAGCTGSQTYRTLIRYVAFNTTADADSHVVSFKIGTNTCLIGTANAFAAYDVRVIVPPSTTCTLTTPVAAHNDTICAVTYTKIENR